MRLILLIAMLALQACGDDQPLPQYDAVKVFGDCDHDKDGQTFFDEIAQKYVQCLDGNWKEE